MIFNNEGGTPVLERSQVPPATLVDPLRARGWSVHVDPLQARAPSGLTMRMQVIVATRDAPLGAPATGGAT